MFIAGSIHGYIIVQYHDRIEMAKFVALLYKFGIDRFCYIVFLFLVLTRHSLRFTHFHFKRGESESNHEFIFFQLTKGNGVYVYFEGLD